MAVWNLFVMACPKKWLKSLFTDYLSFPSCDTSGWFYSPRLRKFWQSFMINISKGELCAIKIVWNRSNKIVEIASMQWSSIIAHIFKFLNFEMFLIRLFGQWHTLLLFVSQSTCDHELFFDFEQTDEVYQVLIPSSPWRERFRIKFIKTRTQLRHRISILDLCATFE